jgi:hypothetical protein
MGSDVELRQGTSSCAAASWLTAKDIATTGNHQEEGDVSEWFSYLLFCEASFVLPMEAFFACHQYYAIDSNPKPKEAFCSSTWGVIKKPCFVNSWFQLSFNCVLQLHSLWWVVYACDTCIFNEFCILENELCE